MKQNAYWLSMEVSSEPTESGTDERGFSLCLFGEQNLEQKRQDSRPYPEPPALPLTVSEHAATGSMSYRCHEIMAYL